MPTSGETYTSPQSAIIGDRREELNVSLQLAILGNWQEIARLGLSAMMATNIVFQNVG